MAVLKSVSSSQGFVQASRKTAQQIITVCVLLGWKSMARYRAQKSKVEVKIVMKNPLIVPFWHPASLSREFSPCLCKWWETGRKMCATAVPKLPFQSLHLITSQGGDTDHDSWSSRWLGMCQQPRRVWKDWTDPWAWCKACVCCLRV